MCSFKLAVDSMRRASSSISILRFVSITIQAAVIWLLGGREVLLVAIYRISSSKSLWCSNLHSPLPNLTSILERTSGNSEEKKNCAQYQTGRKTNVTTAPAWFCTQHCNPWGCTMIISLHPAWDVLANHRGGPLPHPYQTIQLPLLFLPPKTNQIKETHHNYHVTGTIETWRRSTHSNKPQPSFSRFSLPVFCFIFTLKCLSIWSEEERKQNKKPSNKQKSPTTNNPNQKCQCLRPLWPLQVISMRTQQKVLCDFRSLPATEL